MTADDRSNPHADVALRGAADATLRVVPVAWAALEDAFENNAPEVHSYLHLVTGDVIRVVDGVADPVTHARIVSDGAYRRVDPVSSREQYRWMERFIATVEDITVRQKLLQSIDGKGAFRRFKDALMTFPTERERWFVFRSERLKMCMEAWLEAQGLSAAPRPDWPVPGEPRGDAAAQATDAIPDASLGGVQVTAVVAATSSFGAPASAPTVTSVRKPPPIQSQGRMDRTSESTRTQLVQLVAALPAAELDAAAAFLEFLLSRKIGQASSFAPIPSFEEAAPRRRSSPEPESASATSGHGAGGYVSGNGISVSSAPALNAAHGARESEPPAPRRVVAAREVDISARRPSSAESDVSRRPVVLDTDASRKPMVDGDSKDADPTRRSSGRV